MRGALLQNLTCESRTFPSPSSPLLIYLFSFSELNCLNLSIRVKNITQSPWGQGHFFSPHESLHHEIGLTDHSLHMVPLVQFSCPNHYTQHPFGRVQSLTQITFLTSSHWLCSPVEVGKNKLIIMELGMVWCDVGVWNDTTSLETTETVSQLHFSIILVLFYF